MHRRTWRTYLLEAVMVLAAVVYAFPLYILVNLSLRAPGNLTSPLKPSTNPTLENFTQAWTQGSLGAAMVNSVVITSVSVLLIIVLSSLAAFPLARTTRGWSRIAFFGFLAGLLLPFQLGMIPLYTTMKDLHLLGTLASLIIYYAGLQMPFSIFLYTTFMRAVPREYEESAYIDGAGPITCFRMVVFPLMRPVTGTVAIMTAIFAWHDFLTPLLYVGGTDRETLPVAIYGFVQEYVSQWSLLFAGLIISVVPVLVCYFLMQKRFIAGFAGGLKM